MKEFLSDRMTDIKGENVDLIFLEIEKHCIEHDLPNATLAIQYYEEGDNLGHGDYVPEIHFVLRRIHDPQRKK